MEIVPAMAMKKVGQSHSRGGQVRLDNLRLRLGIWARPAAPDRALVGRIGVFGGLPEPPSGDLRVGRLRRSVTIPRVSEKCSLSSHQPEVVRPAPRFRRPPPPR